MKRILLILSVLLSVPFPLLGAGIDFETKGNTEIYKLRLVERPGEVQWVRIEKTGAVLKFVPTSQQAGKWFDHPATRVSVLPRQCPPTRSPLEKLQSQMTAFKQKSIGAEQYGQSKRDFLAELSVPQLSTCTISGVDSVVLPKETDFSAGARITLDFVQVNKLWTLTFELMPEANKLAVRVLSTSP
ncbi:MAG: hypothetical protein H7Y37_11245 [Anaerolineae bacterium]|nr:hypothetical protein [Gloeobacterales cyanobacterium ES-bin-313]